MNQADRTLSVSGLLNSVAGESWISTADKLARVSNAEFERILAGFRQYRELHGGRKGANDVTPSQR